MKDGVRPMMHPATCSACGMGCEVPFKPNGKKPILCSNCFSTDGSKGLKFAGKDTRGDRHMFKAVCSDCGSHCEVPFRPIEGKAIRYRNCFGHDDVKVSGISKDQFDKLNVKLDTILKLLGAKTSIEEKSDVQTESKKVISLDRPSVETAPAKKAWAKKKYE
ncbi:MAG: CxxC-x17-CxxC domain-containing protein [Patescibacteria group bacterium]